MNTFLMSVNDLPTKAIGFGGENGVTEITCDFSAWASEFGEGDLSLVVRRSMDIDPYPAVLTVDGTKATWTITDIETSYKGSGEAQWVYTVGEKVKKSAIFSFCVNRSLNASAVTAPEAVITWIENLIETSADIHDAEQRVLEATGHYPKIEDGYWYVWDVQTEEWVSTGQKAQGEQGLPGEDGVGIASTVLNADYTLTITLTDGTSYTTSPIRGEPGRQGDPGEDGFSPTANVVKVGDTATITITDKNGTTTATVTDGSGGSGSSDYSDLTNKPKINNVELSGNKTTFDLGLFSGNYNDLTNKPTLFSGNYNDLSNKPTLSTVATSGSYNDLSGKPTIPTTASDIGAMDASDYTSETWTFTLSDNTTVTKKVVVEA